MIVNAIIDLVVTVFGAMFSVLPDTSGSSEFSIPFLSTVGGWFGAIGSYLGKFDSIVPVVWMLNVVSTILDVLLPTALLAKVVMWIYKHIPQVAGTGPGGG